MFQKNITKKVITNLCQKNINVSQYKEHNYTSNNTTIEQQNNKKYHQQYLSPSNFVRYPLLDPLPTQLITPQQTCIPPSF